MEIWVSKARRPLEHEIATDVLTFIYGDRGCDIFSDLGNPGRGRLYRSRLRRARNARAIQASERAAARKAK